MTIIITSIVILTIAKNYFGVMVSILFATWFICMCTTYFATYTKEPEKIPVYLSLVTSLLIFTNSVYLYYVLYLR